MASGSSSPSFPINLSPGILLVTAGWLASTVLYRLYLHPLAKVPGPKLAALTSWYECSYDVIQPGRYVLKIKELHQQYGPIIRINPREVHINDPDYLPTIYPLSQLRKRDKDPTQTRGLDVGLSTAGTGGHELHRRRRDALGPFFSGKNVLGLESMIWEKVEQICGVLNNCVKEAESGGGERLERRAVNLYDLYYAFARDIVFQYSFGKRSNVSGDMNEAAALRRNLTRLLLGVKITKHFYPVFWVLRRLPVWLGRYVVPPGAKNMRDIAMSVRGEIDQVLTDKSNAQKTQRRSIFYELRDHPDIVASEKHPHRLQQEGTMLVMAGTEATAKALALAHYHLLASPTILSRLRAELAPHLPNPSLSTIQRLPYLAAMISEATRLSFGLTGRNVRIAPDEALRYAGYTIRPRTPVSMCTLCAHTNENIFPDPWRFDPERWLVGECETGEKAREEKMKAVKERENCNLGFGKGARRCLGVSLARAEMMMVLVAVVARFEMRLFETDESDVAFQHDFQVAHAKLDSKGVRAMVMGRIQK